MLWFDVLLSMPTPRRSAAKKMVREGDVKAITQDQFGDLHAIVGKQREFQVIMTIKNQRLKGHRCSCDHPYREYCLHKLALLEHLLQEEEKK